MRINPIDPIFRHSHKKKQNDNAYLEWLRSQPCCVCGASPRSQAAHYRTAANSGIGIKPLRSAIPLCYPCHAESHRIGTYNFMAKEKWEELVDKHLKMFNNSKL